MNIYNNFFSLKLCTPTLHNQSMHSENWCSSAFVTGTVTLYVRQCYTNMFCLPSHILSGKSENVLQCLQFLSAEMRTVSKYVCSHPAHQSHVYTSSPLSKALVVPLRTSRVRAAMMSACRAMASALSTASAPNEVII